MALARRGQKGRRGLEGRLATHCMDICHSQAGNNDETKDILSGMLTTRIVA